METSISPSTLDLAGPISPTVLLSGNEKSQPNQTKKFKSAQPPKRATEIFQLLQEVRNPTTKTITGYNCAICKSAQQFGLKVGGSWVDNPFQDLNNLKECATMHNSTTLHKNTVKALAKELPNIEQKFPVNWCSMCTALGLDPVLASSIETEWNVFRRRPTINITVIVINPSESVMFLDLRLAAIRLLLLPSSSAEAERSFSTMSRILTNLRNRLTEGHLEDLLFCEMEGPDIPDPGNY